MSYDYLSAPVPIPANPARSSMWSEKRGYLPYGYIMMGKYKKLRLINSPLHIYGDFAHHCLGECVQRRINTNNEYDGSWGESVMVLYLMRFLKTSIKWELYALYEGKFTNSILMRRWDHVSFVEVKWWSMWKEVKWEEVTKGMIIYPVSPGQFGFHDEWEGKRFFDRGESKGRDRKKSIGFWIIEE